MPMPARRCLLLLLLAATLSAVLACGSGDRRPALRLRLATTTSTYDTGLTAALLPSFEQACGCRVDVIAVGTGQALEIAARGDADAVLVHSPAAEERFVAQGHARVRRPVMFNDFVIVGPPADPAGAGKAAGVRGAFAAIAEAGSRFVSRGDRSGTHAKEQEIWRGTEHQPSPNQNPWYLSVGQGMGETLMFTNEQSAYAISDRATFLSMRDRLPNLAIVIGGSRIEENPHDELCNRYSVMVVTPGGRPGPNEVLASRFADWLTAVDTQRRIGEFGRDRFGQTLFQPDSEPFRAAVEQEREGARVK